MPTLNVLSYLWRSKTAQLYVAGAALLEIEEYAQYLGRGGGHHQDLQLYQDTVALRKYLDVSGLYARITAHHSLHFVDYGRLQGLDLIFKLEVPQHCAVVGAARELALAYEKSIEQVAFDQVKISQGKLLGLTDGVESSECGHDGLFTAGQQRLFVVYE